MPLGSKEDKLGIEFNFYFKNYANEPDLDNLISSALDLMAVSGIIANDRWVYSLNGSTKYMNTGIEATVIKITKVDPVDTNTEALEHWINQWANR